MEEARPEREQDAHLKHTAVNRRRARGCPPGVCARHGSHAPSLGTRHASYGAGPPCSGAAGEETASDKVVAPELTDARCRPPKVPQLRDAGTVAHDTRAPKVRTWVSWGGSLGRRYDKGEIEFFKGNSGLLKKLQKLPRTYPNEDRKRGLALNMDSHAVKGI